jgi:hypothetical protein
MLIESGSKFSLDSGGKTFLSCGFKVVKNDVMEIIVSEYSILDLHDKPVATKLSSFVLKKNHFPDSKRRKVPNIIVNSTFNHARSNWNI